VDQHDAFAGIRTGRGRGIVERRQGRQAGRNRLVAPRAAGDNGNDAVRQPRRGSDGVNPSGRRHHHDALHRRRGRQRRDRPGQERPPANRVIELVDAAHPARRSGGHDDCVGRGACR
jgi:hypothetical protein